MNLQSKERRITRAEKKIPTVFLSDKKLELGIISVLVMFGHTVILIFQQMCEKSSLVFVFINYYGLVL